MLGLEGVETPPELLFGAFVRRVCLSLRRLSGVVDLLIVNERFATSPKPPAPEVTVCVCPSWPRGRCEASSPCRRWFLEKVRMVACAFPGSHLTQLAWFIWQLRWKMPSDSHAVIFYILCEALKSCT